MNHRRPDGSRQDRYVPGPWFLRRMWRDEKPTRAQGYGLATTTIISCLIAAESVSAAGDRGWAFILWWAIACAIWVAVIMVLISIPRVQRWIWDGK